MAVKNCGECAKLRTEKCIKPDECVQGGYKYFLRLNGYDYRADPSHCPHCGEKTAVMGADNTEKNGKKRYRYCLDEDCPWLTDPENKTGKRWSSPSLERLV